MKRSQHHAGPARRPRVIGSEHSVKIARQGLQCRVVKQQRGRQRATESLGECVPQFDGHQESRPSSWSGCRRSRGRAASSAKTLAACLATSCTNRAERRVGTAFSNSPGTIAPQVEAPGRVFPLGCLARHLGEQSLLTARRTPGQKARPTHVHDGDLSRFRRQDALQRAQPLLRAERRKALRGDSFCYSAPRRCAHVAPRAPVDTRSRKTLSAPSVGQSILEGIRRRVVALPEWPRNDTADENRTKKSRGVSRVSACKIQEPLTLAAITLANRLQSCWSNTPSSSAPAAWITPLSGGRSRHVQRRPPEPDLRVTHRPARRVPAPPLLEPCNCF